MVNELTPDKVEARLLKIGVSIEDFAALCALPTDVMNRIIIGEDPMPPNVVAVCLLLCSVGPLARKRALKKFEDGYRWVPIPGCPYYEISTLGEVRRRRSGSGAVTGTQLKHFPDAYGYHCVTVSDDKGLQRKVKVHRMVCEVFHGHAPTDGHMVCHKDDDLTNNAATNLYWGTWHDNAADRKRNRYQKTRAKFWAKSVEPITK